MKLLITTPSLEVPHGGTRVLNEWATGLAKYHDVTLLVNKGPLNCDWYELPKSIQLTKDKKAIQAADCVIIGSPHAIGLTKLLHPQQSCFIFLQMIEHLFNEQNDHFAALCAETYRSKYPVICISKWNACYLRDAGRDGVIFYIGNGINTTQFPIVPKVKRTGTILVEGWECNNAAKDVENIGAKVAERLKSEGYTIIAYSQLPLKTLADVPDEYYQKPDLQKLNSLYERADILIKASRFDARSTAPIEAMTKGTVCARAIEMGDDDLVHEVNCLKVPYDELRLYLAAKRLLNNKELYTRLSNNCISHVRQYNWDYWMPKINDIICKRRLLQGVESVP